MQLEQLMAEIEALVMNQTFDRAAETIEVLSAVTRVLSLHQERRLSAYKIPADFLRSSVPWGTDGQD